MSLKSNWITPAKPATIQYEPWFNGCFVSCYYPRQWSLGLTCLHCQNFHHPFFQAPHQLNKPLRVLIITHLQKVLDEVLQRFFYLSLNIPLMGIHRLTIELVACIFLLELLQLGLVDLVDAFDLLVVLFGFNVQIRYRLACYFKFIC